MDPASVGASSISLDGVIFALFLLAICALGILVMAFGTNIRKDIAKGFEKLDKHTEDDTEEFRKLNRRVGLHAQRLTKLDGRTEDTE